MSSQKHIAESEAEYLAHNVDVWRQDYFNESNGGYLVVHRNRIERSHISENEGKKLSRELDMANVFAQNGYRVVMLREMPGISSPDVKVNGVLGELKRLSGHNNIAKEAKDAVRKKGAKVVLFQLDELNGKVHHELNKLSLKGIGGYYFVTGENVILPF